MFSCMSGESVTSCSVPCIMRIMVWHGFIELFENKRRPDDNWIYAVSMQPWRVSTIAPVSYHPHVKIRQTFFRVLQLGIHELVCVCSWYSWCRPQLFLLDGASRTWWMVNQNSRFAMPCKPRCACLSGPRPSTFKALRSRNLGWKLMPRICSMTGLPSNPRSRIAGAAKDLSATQLPSFLIASPTHHLFYHCPCENHHIIQCPHSMVCFMQGMPS